MFRSNLPRERGAKIHVIYDDTTGLWLELDVEPQDVSVSDEIIERMVKALNREFYPDA